MREQHYYVCKKGDDRQLIYLDYDKLNGFGFSPKNNIKYDGIVVNKMVIINPEHIDVYLNLLPFTWSFQVSNKGAT